MRAASFGPPSAYWPGRPRAGLIVGLSLGLALVLAVALVLMGWPAAAIALGTAFSLFLVWQPRYGLYIMLAQVVMISAGSSIPLVRATSAFTSGLRGAAGGLLTVSPLEFGIGLMLLGTILQAGRGHRLRMGDLFWPAALLMAVILFAYLRGVIYGGANHLTAFHEIRALLYLIPVYFLTVNLMRERRHFVELTGVFLVSVVVLASDALWTHFSVIRPGTLRTDIDVTFVHTQAMFAGILVIFAVAMIIWGKGNGPRVLLLIPAAVALASIMVMKRRVGVIALDVGLLMIALLTLRQNLRLFLIAMPVLIVAGVIYLNIYWNATGGLGQGARAFRSAIGQEAATEDISSQRYRDLEALNVQFNIRWSPYWGSGFGKPYIFPYPLPDLTGWWPFQRFIPHNTILWTWMKGGIVAFWITMAFFGYATMRGMAVAGKQVLDPLLRSWAVAAAAAVPMVFLYAWYDLGLTSIRTLVLFAICLGFISVLGTWAREAEARQDDRTKLQVKGEPSRA